MNVDPAVAVCRAERMKRRNAIADLIESARPDYERVIHYGATPGYMTPKPCEDPDGRLAEMRRLRAEGETYAAIGKRFGLSGVWTGKLLKEAGV